MIKISFKELSDENKKYIREKYLYPLNLTAFIGLYLSHWKFSYCFTDNIGMIKDLLERDLIEINAELVSFLDKLGYLIIKEDDKFQLSFTNYVLNPDWLGRKFTFTKEGEKIKNDWWKNAIPDAHLKSKGFEQALIESVITKDINNIKLILGTAAPDINYKDELGDTALMYAVRACSSEIVELLLKYPKIDVNIKNICGNTALIYAAKLDFITIANLLLQNPNIDINLKNKLGYDARFYAKPHLRSVITDYQISKAKQLLTQAMELFKNVS